MVRVFDEDNLQYFSEICTPHKDHIGGKGIGRLSFIKYGNSVQVSSQLPSTLVTFDYTPEFSPSNAYKAAKSGDPWTTILISEPKQEVYTQVAKLINGTCDDIRLLLFLKYKSDQAVKIFFVHNSTQPFPSKYDFSG